MAKRRHLSGAELLRHRQMQKAEQEKKEKPGNAVNRRIEKYNHIAAAVAKAKEEKAKC